jgi:hypothetical protein
MTKPVNAFGELNTLCIHLLHGAHRWRASLAFGFARMPAILAARTEAEEAGDAVRPASSWISIQGSM